MPLPRPATERSGDSLEKAAKVAGHGSTAPTRLYNRVDDEVGIEEIEKIRF